MAGAAVLSMPKTMQAMPAPGDIPADKNSTIKPDAKEEPFHLGMAGFTFRHFDIDQTLDFMQKLNVHYLCIKDFHLPLDSNEEQIAAFKAKLVCGLKGGMLVTNPIPEQYSMPKDVIDAAIAQALQEMDEAGIHGKQCTPFLLAKVKDLTGGESLASNIQLVLNNARLAAQTAKALCEN